jgi:hypothetical protein
MYIRTYSYSENLCNVTPLQSDILSYSNILWGAATIKKCAHTYIKDSVVWHSPRHIFPSPLSVGLKKFIACVYMHSVKHVSMWGWHTLCAGNRISEKCPRMPSSSTQHVVPLQYRNVALDSETYVCWWYYIYYCPNVFSWAHYTYICTYVRTYIPLYTPHRLSLIFVCIVTPRDQIRHDNTRRSTYVCSCTVSVNFL